MRAELDTAASLGERAVSLAQGGLPGWVLWVEGGLASTLLHPWRVRARRALAGAARRYPVAYRLPSAAPAQYRDCLAVLPRALWCLGYPDRATEVAEATQELALREGRKFQIGMRGRGDL